MVKLNYRTHDLMMRGGFQYDSKKDKYFMRGEAEWDVEKRIEKGRKQSAVPAKTIEEFAEMEVKMVDALMEKLKAKAAAEASSKPKKQEAEAEAEEEEPPAKKPKKKREEAEEEDEDEAAAKKAKKEKKEKKKKQEEEEDE
mmetsp:Transcript_9682/g.21902  ORF Transcript_9682/g.21902 Transcript_9682/m.21902 type:complete len:141 (+) Transcript_9682:94-516(+)